jgi:hypothetical protein
VQTFGLGPLFIEKVHYGRVVGRSIF